MTAEIETTPAPFVFLIVMLVIMLVTSYVERFRLKRKLRSHEKRLKAFMQNISLVVMELDCAGHVTYINEFGARLLGYTPEALVGLSWFENFLLAPDISLTRKLYTEILNGKLHTYTFKTVVRCRDGAELSVSWLNFAIQEADGEIQSMMSIGRDVSGEESIARLVAQLQQELEKEKITATEPVQFELDNNVIGKSEAFMYALQRAMQVATTHAPVLLEGETGVGKEVFANLIHQNSLRRSTPFIKVNCGALPKDLIEDELFGHEKGAFTSALQARKGRFELADGGTLFLDEIGELPIDMQPKLLRVLQNGEFERLGGQKTLKVDVRVLAATNRNLAEEVSNGNFREDLYYRLNVFPITIPALRNRKEDLTDLINHFITNKCREYNKSIEQLSRADLQRLIDYPWPGNIRELKNVIERAVITSEGRQIRFDWWQQGGKETANADQTLERIEKDHILSVMTRCHWKINGENGAAETLNMHPNTLRSKMKRLGITRPQHRNGSGETTE
ncbi:sigma 54-interacting transcriptional regulator [Fulvivirgaceae bacterium PWU4]|uniref:Sigma 54-interacting transcriptional regulator n=1 Tax=Chryseosolibacter histidini TaxID=2782349 RepID=A0AAP2DNB1_9BACT|nr:sigma 54-interacting transcriptional regulator [Chryseosolibacter histidini]MBT1699515.1 sigma 54-interacting transcriptional regulator [Chryseosolibacter histidini]